MTDYGRRDFARTEPRSVERVTSCVPWIAALVVAALAVVFPADLYAHLSLRESAPAANSRLTIAPTAIRLSFTERVEVALSRIELEGPRGQVVLGRLIREGSGDILSVGLEGGISAGEYRVRWQAVGRDGHPVHGEFVFTVEPGAVGAVSEEPRSRAGLVTEAPDSIRVGAAEGEGGASAQRGFATTEARRFTTRSPLYAAVRWLMYVGIVGTLGALGFAFLLRSGAMAAVGEAYRATTERAIAVFGLLATLPLGLSLPLRLQAQSHVVFGGGVTRERFAALLGSLWGVAWAVQLAACILAFCGFFIARRRHVGGWLLAAAAGVAVVITPPLSGHAGSVEDFRWIAIAADALHVAGAGAWIGTLAALVLVGIPMVRLQDPTERGPTLSLVVSSFSPFAMAAAGALVVTGAISAMFQLTGPTDLWTTGYGRLLTAKLTIVLLVVVIGAYNWRRMRPVMAEPGSASRLRRTGGAEITAALIVIMLTAALVAVQPPARTMGDAPSSNPTSEMG